MANKIFEFVGVSKKGTERSNFDLSHENKLTMNYGEIVPTLCTQLVPGDSGNINVEHILRQQTMIAPVMQRSNVSHHFFKVPPRLVDRNFTNKRMRWNPYSNTSWDCLATHTRLSEIAKLSLEDLGLPLTYWRPSKDPLTPNYFNATDSCLSQSGSLMDYLGIPCGPHWEYKSIENADGSFRSGWINSTPAALYGALTSLVYDDDSDVNMQGGDAVINLYPFLCYQLVYMTFYRAQDYETDWLHPILEAIQTISDSGECVTIENLGLDSFKKIFTLRHRGYSKDYFTSALPHALKSTEWPDGVRVPTNDSQSSPNSFSIEMLRLANAVQQWLERDARGGTRYPEWTLSHYGVNSSNALLDLPEFVGGAVAPLSVSDVEQNSPMNSDSFGRQNIDYMDGSTPLGSVAGKSVNYDSSGNIRFYTEEDSYLFCFTTVMPKQGYSQGIKKELLRNDFLDDYYMPEFANLGEQSVKSKELVHYFAGVDVTNGTLGFTEQNQFFDLSTINSRVIGYQSRYADWKFLPDEIHGEFRNSLNYWHMSRIFPYIHDVIPYNGMVINTLLNIGKDFIACHPADVDRVFAVESQVSSQLKLQIFFDMQMRRPMPEFPIPSL